MRQPHERHSRERRIIKAFRDAAKNYIPCAWDISQRIVMGYRNLKEAREHVASGPWPIWSQEGIRIDRRDMQWAINYQEKEAK